MKSYLLDLWDSGRLSIKVNVLALIRFVRKIMKWRRRWIINHGKNVQEDSD